MRRLLHGAILCATLLGVTVAVNGYNYMYLSNYETTRFEEIIRFWHADTLTGVVRSNDRIYCMQNPVFTDLVITSAPCSTYDECLGPNYRCGVPPILIPERAEYVRSMATLQGNWFGQAGDIVMVNLRGSELRCWRWPNSTPPDSSDAWTIELPDTEQLFCFFDCPIRIRGVLTGNLVIGCSNIIGIEDNVLYSDANIDNATTPVTSTNYLTLVSEADIKIRNTPENGRENSAGLGNNQPNRNLTDVVITANLFALGSEARNDGSFTFENQNDPDSGYVCECQPDDRGSIYLYGGLNQRRRGYVHRSTRGSTGYLKNYRFDPRIRDLPNLVLDTPPFQDVPDTLDFGDVTVNTTAWDTLMITSQWDVAVYGAYATYPFYSSGAIPPGFGDTIYVPVRFTPTQTAQYSGFMTVIADFGSPVITLRGRGIPLLDAGEPKAVAQEFGLSIYPNPFNSIASISISLPDQTSASLRVFDLLGREVKSWEFGAGEAKRQVHFDGTALGTGIYLAVLESERGTAREKLLLLK